MELAVFRNLLIRDIAIVAEVVEVVDKFRLQTILMSIAYAVYISFAVVVVVILGDHTSRTECLNALHFLLL